MPISRKAFSLYLSRKNPRSSTNTLGSRTKALSRGVFRTFMESQLEDMFFQHLQQVSPISVIFHGHRRAFDLILVNVAVTISDLFGAGHHQSLAGFNGLNKKRSLEHGFMGACVEPSHAAAHDRDVESPTFQIFAVHVGDFELATRRRFQRAGDFDYLRTIKVEAGDRVPRLGDAWLFFQADGFSLRIKLDHSVALRIMHRIRKDASALFAFSCIFHALSEIVSVEDVVT